MAEYKKIVLYDGDEDGYSGGSASEASFTYIFPPPIHGGMDREATDRSWFTHLRSSIRAFRRRLRQQDWLQVPDVHVLGYLFALLCCVFVLCWRHSRTHKKRSARRSRQSGLAGSGRTERRGDVLDQGPERHVLRREDTVLPRCGVVDETATEARCVHPKDEASMCP
ncbi:uncharacterized protein LOC112679451 [Sipha flava]|uniref:Uncharacterized protein LOC112679451 n=1 Tax=Sipha flava TaxID=143950 RepID=A0A8B8F313_9HEMI|nr:uncharacterized protein LOC112679451 [Sipha flava]